MSTRGETIEELLTTAFKHPTWDKIMNSLQQHRQDIVDDINAHKLRIEHDVHTCRNLEEMLGRLDAFLVKANETDIYNSEREPVSPVVVQMAGHGKKRAYKKVSERVLGLLREAGEGARLTNDEILVAYLKQWPETDVTAISLLTRDIRGTTSRMSQAYDGRLHSELIPKMRCKAYWINNDHYKNILP